MPDLRYRVTMLVLRSNIASMKLSSDQDPVSSTIRARGLLLKLAPLGLWTTVVEWPESPWPKTRWPIVNRTTPATIPPTIVVRGCYVPIP